MFTVLRSKILPWMILLGVCLPMTIRAQDAELDTHLAQARVFLKKGWYRDAVKELRRAVSSKGGEKSFQAHFLLSQACFKEMDLRCAIGGAEKARTMARKPQERGNSQDLLDYLHQNFGKVEFKAGENEVKEGYLELEALDPILDKEVKAYHNKKVKPLADQRRSLPWIMYLPAIRYKLYGQEFKVKGGEEIAVNAGFTPENSKPKPPKPPPPPEFEGIGVAIQVRLGGGMTLTNMGEGGDTAFGGVADISAQKTFGEMFGAGAFAKVNYDLMSANNTTLTYGLVASAKIGITEKLFFTPALAYSYGDGPAWTFRECQALVVDGAETIDCGGDVAGDVVAVLNTRVHGPTLRLEMAYEKVTELVVFRGQVGAQAQYGLMGSVASGKGTYEGQSQVIQYTVPDGFSVHPLRIEVLAGLNMTF